jgi:signal transduction histidine kinase
VSSTNEHTLLSLFTCQFERSSLKILSCSSALATILGDSEPNEWIGKFVINMFSPCSFEELKRLFDGKSSTGCFCRLANQEGENLGVAVAIQESNKGVTTMLCIPVADHSATVQHLQSELSIIKNKLKDLGDLNSLMVHDLNGLLNVILLSLDYIQIKNPILPSETQDNFNRIFRISQRMGLLLNDLSNFRRYEIGDYPAEIIDMNVLVDSIINEFEPPQVKKVTITRSSDLPNILCNKALIREVFHNLIENSVLYSNTDITVEIGKVTKEQTNHYFVKDTGVGIPESEFKNVFSPLIRADHQQLNTRGTGMGLAQVKQIIQRHNGKIWITSTVDIGTTIWFTLEMQ